MKTNKIIAGMVLGVAFPALYYTWVMTVKNTWIDNDIIDSHPDVLNPDKGRFGRRSPQRQFEEALIFKAEDKRD